VKKVLIVVLVLVLLGAGGAYYYLNFMAPAEEEEQTEKVITKTIALGAKQPEGVPVPITTVPQAVTTPGAPAATAPPAAPAATAPAPAATAKPQVAATVAPAPKPQPTAAAVTFKPWVVNVASLPKKQDAENLAKKLGDAGFNVYQMSADVKGTKWYRVRVGFYDSKADAEAASKKLKGKDKNIDDPWMVKIDKAEFDKYVK